jgi:hypothetical protein
MFNGDTVRYAWIGVNGALALSLSPTDTQDIGTPAGFNPDWTIPNGLQHNGRADTGGKFGVPKNIIAPLSMNFHVNCATIAKNHSYFGDTPVYC